MDRRGFLGLLGKAVASATVAYSFPSVIVPKNLGEVVVVDDIATINSITRQELWPKLIEDYWFTETPLFARLREYV